MNLNHNPSQEELRALLAGYDDTAGHHVLWAAADGEVHITTLPRVWPPGDFTAPPDMRLRYETFHAGKGYVGPEAAADDEWVSEQFHRLVKEWDKAKENAEPKLIRVD